MTGAAKITNSNITLVIIFFLNFFPKRVKTRQRYDTYTPAFYNISSAALLYPQHSLHHLALAHQLIAQS